jgi:pimeloyl-ACP methyl ester carboxylesterase
MMAAPGRRQPKSPRDRHRRRPAAGSEGHARHFTGPYRRKVAPVAGHFLPREAPDAVAAAIQALGGS